MDTTRIFAFPPVAPELFIYAMRSYDFVGNAIAALTDGDWSHVGIGVFNPDGSAVVYEAILADNAIDRRDARTRFLSFLAQNKGARLMVVPLTREQFGYDDATVNRVLAYADTCVKDVSYGTWQLLGMALAQRFGIPVPSSATKQVCSEFIARSLGGGDDEKAAVRVFDLRDCRHNTYDLVTPSSVMRRIMDMLAGYGGYTRNPPVMLAPTIM